MAQATIEFELVSPERLLLSEPAEMVVMLGTDGYFGVMYGHVAMISSLKAGVVDVYQDGKIKRQLFVAGGFAEVMAERCTLLAEEAVDVEDLNAELLGEQIKNIQEEIRLATDALAKKHLENSLLIAQTKKDAALKLVAA
ncbi:MAG: ATP synthase F1 subunit epsilon [Alphaproteobacteria bacterium]